METLLTKKFSILHIAVDEKFINSAKYIFNKAFPNKNSYLIYIHHPNAQLKHVEKDNDTEVDTFKEGFDSKAAAKTEKFDLVILHGLFDFTCAIFSKAKNKEKFIGLFWGGEIYDNKNLYGKSIYGNKTKLLGKWLKLLSFKKEMLHKTRINNYTQYKIENHQRESLKELKYFALFIKEEYDAFKKLELLSSSCQYLYYSYLPLEFALGNYIDSKIEGNNILVGNSATPSNNHLEAFSLIKKIDLKGRNVIVPLSYGQKDYAKHIIRFGKNAFGKQFVPLVDFMPLEEYNKILSSCSIVIMNQYRQQAIGNVLASIWMGGKAFLDPKNALYHYLKRVGISVFSTTEDLVTSNIPIFEKLTTESVNKNRAILKSQIGEENIIKSLKKDIGKILNVSL